MATMDTDQATHAFVIRIWREPTASKAGAWRGQVEHLQSGATIYFTDLRDMASFVAVHGNITDPELHH
jgi:hypothetical protein